MKYKARICYFKPYAQLQDSKSYHNYSVTLLSGKKINLLDTIGFITDLPV